MQGDPGTKEKNNDLENSTGAGTCFFELNISVRSTYICQSRQHQIKDHKLFEYLNLRENLTEVIQTPGPYLILWYDDQITLYLTLYHYTINQCLQNSFNGQSIL